jgi:hypothetical protein
MGKLFVTLFAPPRRDFVAGLLNFCFCTQDRFVIVLAPALRSAQGARICTQLYFCTVINFYLRDSLYRDTAPVPVNSFVTGDKFVAPIKLVPRHALCSIKFVPGRQKVRHTLPACRQAGLHRDPSLRSGLLAKEPGPCPVLASGNTTSPYCRAVMFKR